MRDRKDVVLADSRRVAQSVMSTDWQWTPQRIKDAVVVTSKAQLALLRGSVEGTLDVYVAGDYPSSDYDDIHMTLMLFQAVWANPFAGDTMVKLQGPRSSRRAS